MKRLMQWGLLLAAAVGVLAVAGCRQDFKVPAGCKAKAGVVAEPYSKTGWAREIVHEKTGIELVYIPAGTFMMGSPADDDERGEDENQHRVTISKGFYMGKYEVTQAQWEKVMGENPSFFKGDNLPVERVSWKDCHIFCEKAGFRLPTEAEWEYACRAGTTTKYAGSGKINDLDTMGWDLIASNLVTHPIGLKKPNQWGVYDMHGNVSELCSDWYGYYPMTDVTDPTGPTNTGEILPRVCRGGGVNSLDYRSASRDVQMPNERWKYTGFRVALPAVQ